MAPSSDMLLLSCLFPLSFLSSLLISPSYLACFFYAEKSLLMIAELPFPETLFGQVFQMSNYFFGSLFLSTILGQVERLLPCRCCLQAFVMLFLLSTPAFGGWSLSCHFGIYMAVDAAVLCAYGFLLQCAAGMRYTLYIMYMTAFQTWLDVNKPPALMLSCL